MSSYNENYYCEICYFNFLVCAEFIQVVKTNYIYIVYSIKSIRKLCFLWGKRELLIIWAFCKQIRFFLLWFKHFIPNI